MRRIGPGPDGGFSYCCPGTPCCQKPEKSGTGPDAPEAIPAGRTRPSAKAAFSNTRRNTYRYIQDPSKKLVTYHLCTDGRSRSAKLPHQETVVPFIRYLAWNF